MKVFQKLPGNWKYLVKVVRTKLSAAAMSTVSRVFMTRIKLIGNDALMRSATSVGGPPSQ